MKPNTLFRSEIGNNFNIHKYSISKTRGPTLLHNFNNRPCICCLYTFYKKYKPF